MPRKTEEGRLPPPKLTQARDQVREVLAAQTAKGESIRDTTINSKEELDAAKDEYHRWNNYNKELLTRVFDNRSKADEYAFFAGAAFTISPFSHTPLSEYVSDFRASVATKITRLRTIHDQLDLIPETDATRPPVSQISTSEQVRRVARRFDIVARELLDRHQNRATLDITDEYDVQDLFRALLKVFFDDLRIEEWTPSYAGSSKRMDFLLPEEQIADELKKTRTGLADKEVGDQLIVDKDHYRHHPRCRTLVCFVYDPDRCIRNPRGLERDLTESGISFSTYVLVAP